MTHLVLPLPIAVNKWPSHPFARHRVKRKYQREAWFAACAQHRPLRTPPSKVRVSATLYVWNLRDEEGAVGSLKWALDALRQEQQGSEEWRYGVADQCGYFVDDNPAHLTLGTVEQVIDRKNMRLELTVETIEEAA